MRNHWIGDLAGLLLFVASAGCEGQGPGDDRSKGTTQASAQRTSAAATEAPIDPERVDDNDAEDEAMIGPSFFDDATGIPRLYEGKLPQPATLFSLKIKASRVFLGALQAQNSAHGDIYLYRKGSVGAPTPVSDSIVSGATKVPLASLDFKLIPRLIADAKVRAAIDGASVKAVDLYLGGFRVRLVGPRASAKVDYTLSGEFKQIKKQ